MTDKVQRLIRLPKQLDDKLRKIAFDKRTSVAKVVEEIVTKALRK